MIFRQFTKIYIFVKLNQIMNLKKFIWIALSLYFVPWVINQAVLNWDPKMPSVKVQTRGEYIYG